MQAKRLVIENQCPIDIGQMIAGKCTADYLSRAHGSSRALIVTDREVSGYYMKKFSEAFSGTGGAPAHVIIDGNPSSKNTDMLSAIYERLSDLDYDYVIALGGGGVIDVATFAASTFGKGIKSILVPTTMLSMLESVMATHSTLHFQSRKDMIRVPMSPAYAVVDISFLKTLPARYLANGIAQIIQYGLIDDPSLLRALASSKELDALIEDALRIGGNIHKSNPELLAFGKDLSDVIECYFRFLKYTPGEAMALSLLAHCPSVAMHRLYDRLGLPQILTEVTKDALMKRIAHSIGKPGKTVELIRIGPLKKPVIDRVPFDTALKFYETALAEICH